MKLRRVLAIVGLAAALAGCAGGNTPLDTVGGGVAPTDFSIHGIDVSKFQGEIDWSQVKGSGIQFAWIKATEGGDQVDTQFARNWSEAKAVGIARGAYHFVYWCRPWREQMNWFEQHVPREGDALPPVLDVELTPTSPTCRRTLYREQTLAEMRGMLAEMERYFGRKPVIYTTVDFYGGILVNGDLGDYPIWVRSTKYAPSIKYNRKWHFWQYQSDGRIGGIRGKVDRNAFFGSPEQWAAFLNGGPLPLD